MVMYSSGASRLVKARPTGEVTDKGSITTTADYQTICAITVTNGKTFYTAKLSVSGDQDVMAKLTFDGADVSIEHYIAGGTPFTNWYPWGWEPMEGDGSKKLELKAKFPAGGVAGTVFGEICGEEDG